MTRFARAHGSKASNERTPEEATSWSTMKHQMIASKQKEPVFEKVTSVYMKGQHNNSVKNPVNKIWEVFDTDTNGKEYNAPKEHSKKNNNYSNCSSAVLNSNRKKNSFFNKSKNCSISKTLSEKCHIKGNTFIISPKITEADDNKNNLCSTDEHACLKKNNDSRPSSFDYSNNNFTEQRKYTPMSNISGSKQLNLQKSKNICNKRKFCEPVGNIVEGGTVNSKKSEKNNITKNKNPDISQCTGNSQTKFKKMKANGNDFSFSNVNKFKYSQKFTMNIGGRIVEISDFQGFAVKKEDAQRLYKLRKDLLSKGLPRKEVEVALKLERRRAEKALAREKKVVCFKCRKSGHNMADCTECEDPSGVCFKCGSTEHSVRECRVVQSESFRYAHCFICQEQGHIARQCPDNPRGLYPKGGACKVCGDVTHLKKDCPKLISEKDKSTITVGTVQNDSIEFLDEDLNKGIKSRNLSKTTKCVKF